MNVALEVESVIFHNIIIDDCLIIISENEGNGAKCYVTVLLCVPCAMGYWYELFGLQFN